EADALAVQVEVATATLDGAEADVRVDDIVAESHVHVIQMRMGRRPEPRIVDLDRVEERLRIADVRLRHALDPDRPPAPDRSRVPDVVAAALLSLRLSERIVER